MPYQKFDSSFQDSEYQEIEDLLDIHPTYSYSSTVNNSKRQLYHNTENSAKRMCLANTTNTAHNKRTLNSNCSQIELERLERRNARERSRVEQVNNGFNKLQQVISNTDYYKSLANLNQLNELDNDKENYITELHTSLNKKSLKNIDKRISKLKILKIASDYIKYLTNLLNESENMSEKSFNGIYELNNQQDELMNLNANNSINKLETGISTNKINKNSSRFFNSSYSTCYDFNRTTVRFLSQFFYININNNTSNKLFSDLISMFIYLHFISYLMFI